MRTRFEKFSAHKVQRNGARKIQRNGTRKGAHKALERKGIFANCHVFTIAKDEHHAAWGRTPSTK